MGQGASSTMNLENIFVNDLRTTFETNRNVNCGSSGSGSNSIVIGPSDGCDISLENIQMLNEYQSFCDIEMAFKTAAESDLTNKIDNTVANQIIQEGLGIAQSSEMSTNVTNKIQNMITNNSFNSEYVRCTEDHDFKNELLIEPCKDSTIEAKELIYENLGKIDCLMNSSFEAKAKNEIETDVKNDLQNKIEQTGLFACGSCFVILLIIVVLVVVGGGGFFTYKSMKNNNK